MTKTINKTAEINSYYFTAGKNLKSFPKSITVGKAHYTFQDGLRFLVQTAGGMVKLFSMTDGQSSYRLRQQGAKWTLISMDI